VAVYNITNALIGNKKKIFAFPQKYYRKSFLSTISVIPFSGHYHKIFPLVIYHLDNNIVKKKKLFKTNVN